jgi:uncharacterized protein (DUF1330 family)
MPVYMFSEAKLKDPEKYDQYTSALSDIVAKHGGRCLVRGGSIKPLFKGRELERRYPDEVIIVEFPSEAEHRRCFTSPEYQAIVPLREAGADIRAVLLQGYTPEKL